MRKAVARISLFSTLSFLVALAPPTTARAAEEAPERSKGPQQLHALKYRLVGPAVGGRATRVAGVPGDPLTYYLATASGGIWKSVDGGFRWKPIFDDQTTASVGSIAVAASDPNVIYAGTGEANIRGDVVPGDGIYRSTDAGKTWSHVFKQVGQIGTVAVHPANPDSAFAAVLGHAFGPNPERGVYRTTDGGKSWQLVLKKDADTGASDVCLDPRNPRIVFAGLWQARRRPWELTSGGPGSGLFVSRDGGDTWKQIKGPDLPDAPWGKVGVAVAPSDSRRIYALIEAAKGGLFRSDDGGETWSRVSDHRALQQRAWYYSTLTIDPVNPDVVYFPQVPLLRTIDGGRTVKQVKGPHHSDHHDLWIDPKNPKRMIDGNDGGVDISLDGGETWFAPRLPLGQFYHVAVDNSVPYRVSGAMQDLGTASGPSNSLSSGGITLADWHDVGGGEAGFTAHDPSDPNLVYAGEYMGIITRYDHRTGAAPNLSVDPDNFSGHGAADTRNRFNWTAPIAVSPHDPKLIYHAAQLLYESRDDGASWNPISPDLTRNDKSRQQWSGGPITGDNTGVEYYGTIFALAESRLQKGLLWVGTDDGQVQLTRDGGATWTNLTSRIPKLPEWGSVAAIEPSPHAAATAYLVVDAHRLDDMRPHLFQTTDFGRTWKSLAAGLPQDASLHVVREDPARRGLLFVGSDRGVSFSKDDGATWQALGLNLPTVPVHDLAIKDDDLVVGTHGRSIWILDDLTPIRESSSAVLEKAAHLFSIRPAIRWQVRAGFHDQGPGQNPPVGAVIHYLLKEKPQADIRLDITDGRGRTVRTLTSEKAVREIEADDPDAPEEEEKKTVLTLDPGVNRVVWDLKWASAKKIRRAKAEGEPEAAPLAAPGPYLVKLTVDKETYTAPLELRPDPRSTVAPAALEEQVGLALSIRDAVGRVTGIVEPLRSVREQLGLRNQSLASDPAAALWTGASKDAIAKLDALERTLHNPDAQVEYDILARGTRLYSRLLTLLGVACSHAGPPTQGMREVFDRLEREASAGESAWKAFVAGPLAELDRKARESGLADVAVVSP